MQQMTLYNVLPHRRFTMMGDTHHLILMKGCLFLLSDIASFVLNVHFHLLLYQMTMSKRSRIDIGTHQFLLCLRKLGISHVNRKS